MRACAKNSCKIESGGIRIILPDEISQNSDGVWDTTARSAGHVISLTRNIPLDIRTIVIDPGHGGNDPGAISAVHKVKEKDLNLDLALKLGNALAEHGFNVLYTRNDDSTVALKTRGGRFKADLFISIHHNSSKNISASGAETYCLLSDDSENSGKISQALQIACEIQKGQSEASGNYGRGVKFAKFRVLKDAQCPAILFETGFLSNPDEEKRCASAEFRQIMADALAKGIVRAVSLSKR